MKKTFFLFLAFLILIFIFSIGVSAENIEYDSIRLTDEEAAFLLQEGYDLSEITENVIKVYHFNYPASENTTRDLDSIIADPWKDENGYMYIYKDDVNDEYRIYTFMYNPYSWNYGAFNQQYFDEFGMIFDYARSPEKVFPNTLLTSQLEDLEVYQTFCLCSDVSYGFVFYKTNQGDFVLYHGGESVGNTNVSFLFPMDTFWRATDLARQEHDWRMELKGSLVLGTSDFNMWDIVNLLEDMQQYVVGDTVIPMGYYERARTSEEVAAWEAAKNAQQAVTPPPTNDDMASEEGCTSVVPSGVAMLTLCGAAIMLLPWKKRKGTR